MDQSFNGRIMKGIGGFYYVETASGLFECKAKGRFRKEKLTPLAGDLVTITVREDKENTIDEILPRRNALKRPPVANIDRLFLVISAVKPLPRTLVIDKLTCIAEKNGIEPVLIFSKTDLAPIDDLLDIYRTTGYMMLFNTQLDEIRKQIAGRVCAFTGNSGVGKTTLINRLDPSLALETNEISEKLGRGKHTTRQAELFHIADGFVIDTAGFSSLDLLQNEGILKEDLADCFPEFRPYLGACKFSTCAHIGEKGCKICEMVENGALSESRHKSYCTLYEDAKTIRYWEL
jgi:ribosome biogenesis GTPase